MGIWRHRPKIDLGFGCSSPSCLELLETTKEGSMPAEQNIHYGVVFPWSRPQKSYVPMEHSKQKCLRSMYRTEILQQYIQMLHQTKDSNMFSNRWKGLFRIDVWSFSIGTLDPDHAKTLGHIWHNTYTSIHTSIHIQNTWIDIHIVLYIFISIPSPTGSTVNNLNMELLWYSILFRMLAILLHIYSMCITTIYYSNMYTYKHIYTQFKCTVPAPNKMNYSWTIETLYGTLLQTQWHVLSSEGGWEYMNMPAIKPHGKTSHSLKHCTVQLRVW